VFAFYLISNLGYFLGSEYRALGVAEYSRRVTRYFPYYEIATLFYVGAWIAAHALVRAARGGRLIAR
jgi:hypothetical protein